MFPNSPDMPQVLSDRIVWDENDWLGGLAPQHANNGPLTVGQRGAAFMRNINPFRRLGGITPGFSPSNVSNYGSIDGIITGADADFSGTTPYAYLIQGVTSSTLFHRLDLSLDNVSTSGGFPRTIAHGLHNLIVGQEVIVANSASSTVALYSFTDNTDGGVGLYDATGGFFYDDFISDSGSSRITLSLSKNDPHPFILGDDGAVYLGNGRSLVKIDLETDTTNYATVSTVFSLPRGYVIRSFTKTLNYLVVYASRNNTVSSTYYRGTSLAWFWNYISDRPNFTHTISDNFVTAGFNWNGVPGCFSYGRPGEGRAVSCRLQLFNGSGFEEVAVWPRNPPGNQGVEIYDSMVVWNFGDNSQSFLGAYGSPWKGRVSAGLHFFGEPTGTGQSASVGGICRIFGGFGLYVSSGASDSGGLERFSSGFGPSTSDGAFWQGLLAAPLLQKGMIAKVSAVRVMFRNTASGGRTMTLSLVNDFRADTSMTVISSLSTVTASTMTREYRFDSNADQGIYFTSIAPNITWSVGSGSSDAPTPYRIEVFFEQKRMPRNWT